MLLIISKELILSFSELLERKLILKGNENLEYFLNEKKIHFRGQN